ncbi:MAG: ABC transporter permease subunit [Saprospiraceae bacterium]|nr:ABC transporter permease subunit [Saprospiraceae bacterium]MCF8248704.1 ABC transporter permease subunit [Saprospiraceae bacterium]MCF8278806.1 ABC transporter permease subunit [Bacteroidales bacterium]MCF8310606.1 ABC transporter permease subunit [Saprospiraceae bacterium]MCF8439165.1 ABC transporter permease subunit [Saprospiraceae bacterium]
MLRKPLKYTFAAAVLFPFAFLLALSFGQNWRFPAVLPATWTTDNWHFLLAGQSDLGQSLLRSLGISVGIATVATGLSFFTAKHIAYHPWRERWLTVAYFPYVFAPVILAATLQFYFLRLGLAGKVGGVLLAQLFIAYPFGVIFFTGFWNERMRAMEQLSATLGGNGWQTFRRVLVPAAKGALLVCFFQTFLISWFEYGLTSLLGVGKVQTLTVKVFQYIGEANIFYAALASVLLVLPPVGLLWVNKRVLFKT